LRRVPCVDAVAAHGVRYYDGAVTA
jgi:hypothetical protein